LDGLLNGGDVAGEIADRRTLPRRAVGPDAGPANVDKHRLAAQRTVALLWAIGELAATKLDAEHVALHGLLDPDPRHIDLRVRCDDDSPARRLGCEVRRRNDGRLLRGDCHTARRRDDLTAGFERHSQALKGYLRARLGRGVDGLGGIVVLEIN